MPRMQPIKGMLYALCGVLLLYGTAQAHVGVIDANGCHTNPKTGDFHCHTGDSPTYSSDPICPAKQHFSYSKNECTCGSGMEKDKENKCVCKEGFIAATTFCVKLPAHAHKEKKVGWLCDEGYQQRGQSCVPNVTKSHGAARRIQGISRPSRRTGVSGW